MRLTLPLPPSRGAPLELPSTAALRTVSLPPLRLGSGHTVAPHVGAAWISGPADGPVVVLVHALTGGPVAGGPEGWWDPVIGPGRALDTRQVRVVSVALLGGCGGASGPADPRWPTDDGLPVGVDVWDQARAAWSTLDALGVREVGLVVGGSLGGTVALAMAAWAPTRVGRVALFGATDHAGPWVAAWGAVAAELVRAELRGALPPGRGLAWARGVAMVSYRSEAGLSRRFSGRDDVSHWLARHGERLAARFDAGAYLALTHALETADLRRPPADPPPGALRGAPTLGWAVRRLRAPLLAVSLSGDVLVPPRRVRALVGRVRRAGGDATHAQIRSAVGHDAFLTEWTQVATHLRSVSPHLPLEHP